MDHDTHIRQAEGETDIEQALSEAEARFHAVFDVNPAPALIIRLFDERIELVNSGFTDLTGYERREVQHKSLQELGLFVDNQQREAFLEAPRHWQQKEKVEARLKPKSGDHKVVIASVKPLEFHDQVCAILTFADITEQKQAEEHFTQMFRSAPVPSCLIALDSRRFVGVNRSFLEFTGYNEAEVLNRTSHHLELWPSEGERAKIEASLKRREGFRNLDLELRSKEGETRYVLASAEVLDDDMDLLLLMFHDVTQRRRTEEQLRQAIQDVMSDAASFAHLVMERFTNLHSGEEKGTPATTGDLNRRERQVLQRVAKGLSNDAIASELGIATQTVRNYVSSIYDKLGVHTRVEAAVWARERGLGGG